MPAYIARYSGTKRFAGLYAAETDRGLYFLIDEEDDPGDYEFAEMPRGYGVQFRKGDWVVRYRIGSGDEALSAALANVDRIYMTSELRGALADGKGLRWRRLYED